MAGRGRFPRDIQLSARMLLTMFLLGLVYVVFVVALAALRVPLVLVLAIAVVLFGLQYYLSDRIACSAWEAASCPRTRRHSCTASSNGCARSPTKKPRVAIADSDIPNAFATGRNQNAAVVCVTTGIMRRLEEPELEAVLSHELSHVAHRDVAVMTIASFLGILAGLITRFTLFAGFHGGRDGDGDGDGGGLPVIAIVLVSVIVYAISFLLIRALSRYRELAADRSGALLTGAPSKLASALTKVTGEMGRIPTRDLRAAEAFRVLLLPGPGAGVQHLLPVLHPPIAGAAPRPALPDRGRAGEARVKLLDALLGRTKRKEANLDALFALPTAAVTLEAEVGLKPVGRAAVCFKPASGQNFADMRAELEELLQ